MPWQLWKVSTNWLNKVIEQRQLTVESLRLLKLKLVLRSSSLLLSKLNLGIDKHEKASLIQTVVNKFTLHFVCETCYPLKSCCAIESFLVFEHLPNNVSRTISKHLIDSNSRMLADYDMITDYDNKISSSPAIRDDYLISASTDVSRGPFESFITFLVCLSRRNERASIKNMLKHINFLLPR